MQLTYKGQATAAAKVNSESLNRAIDIMRKRVDQLGVAQPEIQLTGEREISVALPDVTNLAQAQAQVGKTAQLFFYDWEPSVIGSSGQPATSESPESERAATGGANPASYTSGLSEYEAVLRALKRPAIIRKNDTTYGQGCTPKQVHGCIYGQWYLLDVTHKKVLKGPEDTEAEALPPATKRRRGSRSKRCASTPARCWRRRCRFSPKTASSSRPRPKAGTCSTTIRHSTAKTSRTRPRASTPTPASRTSLRIQLERRQDVPARDA